MAKRVKHGKAYNIGQDMVRIVGNNPNITDGVSIGANTPDNLQVNNNEVLVGVEASKSGKTLYPTHNSIKVLSAEPMFNGISPVQLLYGGMAPDKAFAIQEQYKDVHGINDDGSRQHAKYGGIYIKPSKRGTFTAAAKQHGMSVQGFASKVLANKENYSSAMVKKANFARNASKWNHLYGGEDILINSLGERPNAKFGKEMKNKRNKAAYGLNQPFYPTYIDGPLVGLRIPQNTLNTPTFSTDFTPKSTIGQIDPFMGVKPGSTILETTPISNSIAKVKPINSVNLTGRVNGPKTGINVPELPQYETLAPATVTASGRPLSSVNLPSQVTTPTIGLRNPFNAPKAISSNSNFAHHVIDKYGVTIGVNGNVTSIKAPETSGLKVPEVTPKASNSSGLSALGADLIGAGINAVGSLIAAGINQNAINKQKFTPRKAVLLNPVKLKTKININPQIAKMREMQAQLTDAARRTSGSSRTAYQKILAGHNRLLESAMGLYSNKENTETELINRDKINQQNIANQNAQNVINTVNTNIAGRDDVNNRTSMLTAQNWINPINVGAGSIVGERGVIAREEARRNTAANLAMMSLAYPDAARMIMSGDGWRKAFDGYYNMLNNTIGV